MQVHSWTPKFAILNFPHHSKQLLVISLLCHLYSFPGPTFCCFASWFALPAKYVALHTPQQGDAAWRRPYWTLSSREADLCRSLGSPKAYASSSQSLLELTCGNKFWLTTNKSDRRTNTNELLKLWMHEGFAQTSLVFLWGWFLNIRVINHLHATRGGGGREPSALRAQVLSHQSLRRRWVGVYSWIKTWF